MTEQYKTKENISKASANPSEQATPLVPSSTPSRPRRKARRPSSYSFFGPIVLISIGLLILAHNFGYLTGELNWWVIGQIWPILLIFAGINMMVRHIKGPIGGLLSAMAGIGAVCFFGAALLFADDFNIISRSETSNNAFQTETIATSAEAVETADVKLNFNSVSAEVSALEDSTDLISGQIVYRGSLDFQTQTVGSRATIDLDTHLFENRFVFFGYSPDSKTNDKWSLGLNPNVPMNLDLDLSSGASNLDLSQLDLTDLVFDSGSGRSDITLPTGNYDALFDTGSGAVTITLPTSGSYNFEMDSGSGSVEFQLPAKAALKLIFDNDESRTFTSNRFEQVNETTWQTTGFDNAKNQIIVTVDDGSGAIRVIDIDGGS